MLKNYLSATFRNLRRNTMLSIVNIGGMSIALAAVMLILLFVKDEYSFDTLQPAGTYRLVQKLTDTAGVEWRRGNTGLTQGPTFAAEIPEIEAFCRLKGWEMTVKKNGQGLESRTLMTDPGFFTLFNFPAVKGNPQHFLDTKNSVVLSDKAAKKYFGSLDVLGKTVQIEAGDTFESFTVSGVVQSPPANSSIQFEMILPFSREVPVNPAEYTEVMNDWTSSSLNTFFSLRKGANPAAAEKKLARVFLAHNAATWDGYKRRTGIKALQYYLQPFSSMHVDATYNVSNGLSNASSLEYSYILSGMAVLILLIAGINFINILLARSLKRSKEIGIRKVIGGSRKQLIFQFLGESGCITAMAFLPAFLLVQLFLPKFSELADKHFNSYYLFQPSSILLFIALWAVVSLLAGIYPAFVASGFKPVQTLYGKVKLSNSTLGRSLVVVQFIIALVLVTCTLILHRQFNYMTTSNLGYRTTNLIRVDFPWDKQQAVRTFRNELAGNPVINDVGAKGGDWNKTKFTIGRKETNWTYFETIDDHFLHILDIPIVKGRNLSYARPADTAFYCLVNEEFVTQLLDHSHSPVGQVIALRGKQYEVAGVVKNYHQASFREKIEPVFFSLDKEKDAHNLVISYLPGKEKEALAVIRKAFKNVAPYAQLSFNFMDEWDRELYSEENAWKEMTTYAAVIAVLISCLGLFALTTLAVQQRVREIGIRKVLGASVTHINSLLSLSFLKLVLVAFLFSLPVSWWAMNNWLQKFAYRIDLGWPVFALSIVLMMGIAWLTVSFHTLRAALANPVKSLRGE